MMHPETQDLIAGPFAQANSLTDALRALEQVKSSAAGRLASKNKSLYIQETTLIPFQDIDFKLHREIDFIIECLTKNEWHTLNGCESDYGDIKKSVVAAKNF